MTTQAQSVADKSDIPIYPGHFLTGNMKEFNEDSLQLMENAVTMGALVRMRFGPFTLYIVNDPDAIHDVLVKQASKLEKPAVTKGALYEALGKGLFTSEGDFWKAQRKLVQPAFHTRRISSYGESMVRYANEVADEWHDGATFNMEDAMTAVTMRIVSKTLFDADVADNEDVLGDAMTKVLSLVDDRFKRFIQVPRWVPTENNRQMREGVAILDEIIQQFIDDRRQQAGGVEDTGDLLSMLLLAQGDDGIGMSDKQVRDEVMTLFSAGHETTANTLTWTWYLLSQNPDAEAQLHAELDRVLGGRTPTLEDLPKLAYTEQVIKETMRIYPAAFSISRQPTEPVTIGGHDFGKLNFFMVNIWGLHRSPEYYPEPHAFKPERWTPENEKQLPKYAYLPFGGGPRVCIGNSFAMMEAQLVLATIAQRYRLSLAEGADVAPVRHFTVRPKAGMPMVAHQR